MQGLFARRRQLLLTEGPHLYYVDPVNKVLKGEIPWSPELRPEAKNFKTFFVHTVKYFRASCIREHTQVAYVFILRYECAEYLALSHSSPDL